MTNGPILVIGATGEVGEGIVHALMGRGHDVIAVGRTEAKLVDLARRVGNPAILRFFTGSLESDEAAVTIAKNAGAFSAVVISVNSFRQPSRLLDHSSDELTQLMRGDLIAHYTAIRTLLPLLPKDGVFIGIGGGSADFILDGGVYMSMAQAALRNMYRGIVHEQSAGEPILKELIIASVVNSRRMQDKADPLWVKAREVGEQVAAMIEEPNKFDGPVWRISRRDDSGNPVVSREGGGDARVLPL